MADQFNPKVNSAIEKLMSDYNTIIAMIEDVKTIIADSPKPHPYDEQFPIITSECVYKLYQETIDHLVAKNTPTKFDKYTHKKVDE